MRAHTKNFMCWMGAALAIFLFWIVSSRIQKNERELSFSDFMNQVERGHVTKVAITGTGAGSQIVGEFKNGQSIRTFAPPHVDNLVNALLERGVEIRARDANNSSWIGHIVSWTPIVIMIAFLIYFMRQMQSSPNASSNVISLSMRKERRLEIKARVLHAFVAGENELSEERLLSLSIDDAATEANKTEFHKALYEMLSEGIIVLTEGRRFRLRTTS